MCGKFLETSFRCSKKGGRTAVKEDQIKSFSIKVKAPILYLAVEEAEVMPDEDEVDNVEQADRGAHLFEENKLDRVDDNDEGSPQEERPHLERYQTIRPWSGG